MNRLATLETINSPPGYHERYTAKPVALTIGALKPVIGSLRIERRAKSALEMVRSNRCAYNSAQKRRARPCSNNAV